MPTPAIQLEIDQHISSFQWNEVGLRVMVRTDVGKDLARRAIRVESAAKRNASGRPGPEVQTGRLRGSITWRLGEDAEGTYADVGSNVFYALFVEEGTSTNPPYPYLVPALEAAHD